VAFGSLSVDGERDPCKLAQLRDWLIRASEKTIMKSLVGDYREELLFTLRSRWSRIGTIRIRFRRSLPE
jgi:hypothetical protein